MDASTMPTTDGSSLDNVALEGSTGKPSYSLRRLDAAQIASNWVALSQTIMATVPGEDDPEPYASSAVFDSLMDGRSQAWVVIADREPPQMCMLVVTRWGYDHTTKHKNLEIYSVFGWEPVPDKPVAAMFEALKTFAKAGGAQRLVAGTSNPKLIQQAEKLGANTDWRLCFWRL